MNQEPVKIDLTEANGRLALAAALGVNQGAVNGLWKMLRRSGEALREVELGALTADLAREFESMRRVSKDERLDILARRYGISPYAVQPLIDYHASRTA